MKRIVFVLILALIGLKLNGQTGPIFPYDDPSKQKLYDLASEDSPKGEAYLSYMVEAINFGLTDTLFKVSKDPEFIMAHLYWEEIYLREGGYKNSGYDSTSQKMNPSLGHEWTGFGWVFRVGSYSVPLIKGNCGNIIKIIPITEKLKPEIPTVPNDFGLKPAQNLSLQGFGNFNQQAVPPVIVNVTNTNTNDFGPLIEALGKLNQPLAQPAVDLKLPATVAEEKSFNPWVPIIIGGVITLGTGTALYLLLRDKGGPVGAPGHGDITGGPVGAPGHGGILKLLFRFH